MIRILADKNLYNLQTFLPEGVGLTLYDPEDGFEISDNCDAMLIRTVTRINPETTPDLPDSLKFIGTGSSGSDHIDRDYLSSKDITVHDAKGCNARAVAEYVITCLLLWAEEEDTDLTKQTIGIVGYGHVGSELGRMFSSLNIHYVAYDPPREVRDFTFSSAEIEEILACDILSFHTPITNSGLYPTNHWMDEDKLQNQSFNCIINSSRGGVTDEKALINAHQNGQIGTLITDVWENEPEFSQEMMNHSFIATPHIAGYSEQAKLRATKMICDQLIRFFDLPEVPTDLLSNSTEVRINDASTFPSVLKALHPVCKYDADLRSLAGRSDAARAFRKLRTDRPFRYEYGNMIISNELAEKYPLLKELGCKTA